MNNSNIEGIYFYELGYGSFEDSGSIQLYHTTNFSHKQFIEMIKHCSIKPAKEELDNQIEFCSKRNLYYKMLDANDVRFEDVALPNVQFDAIYSQVADQLCSIYGFQKVKYKEQIRYFGWFNLIAKKSWPNEVDEEDKELANFLQNELSYSIPED